MSISSGNSTIVSDLTANQEDPAGNLNSNSSVNNMKLQSLVGILLQLSNACLESTNTGLDPEVCILLSYLYIYKHKYI